ncbi:MAG: tripartite ATP-independent transporter DctP family solute receptor [Arenicella sp.]|jgi:tripartite ATP-independent transporter DctP family solute receptor
MTIKIMRNVGLMILALLSLSFIVACSESGSESGSNSNSGSKKIKLGMGDQMDSDQGAFALRYKELIEKYSGGELTVELFPGGMLGTEAEMIQNTRLGALDMALVAATNMTPFAKEFGLLTMPYVISGSDDAVKITTGELGKYWDQVATDKIGVRVLGWTYSDFRHLSNSKRPVKSLSDLKGLKVRVPQNPIMLATYEAWGANPIAMSWTETFTALQQRVVDGQDNPYIVNNSMKFYEVQNYLTEIHYLYSLQPLLIGAKAFAKMSPEDQKTLQRAGIEAQQYALEYQLAEGQNAKQNMQKNGVEVSTLSDEAEWKRIAKEQVWPKFYDSIGGKEKLDNVLKQLNN